VTGRQGRRLKHLLDDLTERRVCVELKEEALDRTVWRIHFGRGYGFVIRCYGKKEWMKHKNEVVFGKEVIER
jgi:hypothetical protein